MASLTAYDYGIRKGLVDKGIANDDIGYNGKTGYVTIKGTDAIKAPKVYNGTSFTNEQDFTNDFNKYQKSLNTTTQVAPTTTQPVATPQSTYNPYQTSNPYDSQYNDLLKSLMDQARNPAPVDVNAIYASPQYAAYAAQAKKGAQQNIRAAQESLGGAGFGRSTALAERAQGIQNDATEYLNTQVVPQLMAAEQNARQQQLQNQFSVLDALMGQQGVYDNRYNNANDLAIRQGQLTGNYMSEQDRAARPLLEQLVQFGQEFGSANAQRQAELRNLANANRATLAAMGIDSSLYNPNLSTEQRQDAIGRLGTRTLGGRAQDLNEEEAQRNAEIDAEARKLDEAYKQADITGVIGPVLGQIYGLPANTPTQAAMVSNRNYALDKKQVESSIANAGADNSRQAETARVSRLETIWKATGQAPAGLESYGVNEGDPYVSGSSGSNPSTKEIESKYIANIKSMSDSDLKDLFTTQEAEIVNDLGIEGYNRLYNKYFDENGNLKKR